MSTAVWSREGGTMRFLLGILIPLTAALLQGTVAPLIAVGEARPSLPILVAASWSIAARAAGLIYVGVLAATGEAVSSVPLAAGTAVASAVYTGVLALAIYPVARLLRRATEKQGALGIW